MSDENIDNFPREILTPEEQKIYEKEVAKLLEENRELATEILGSDEVDDTSIIINCRQGDPV